MYNNILDVKGLKVGQVEDRDGLTGCTVVICEKGAVCGVDVRGGGPGTRETDLLNPINMIQKVHAVVLSGGSAFGLESTCGVSKYLEENNIGFDVGVAKVPIVVGAVLFDLGVGNPKSRPNIEMGYRACQVASDTKLNQGNFGAGCGATVGKIKGIEYAMKGGIGSHSIKLPNGLVVSALVAVNAFGDVYGEPADGLVAFNLDSLPDTEGKTVKLKLKWKSFNGEKTAEFDYCTRKSTPANSAAITAGRSVVRLK